MPPEGGPVCAYREITGQRAGDRGSTPRLATGGSSFRKPCVAFPGIQGSPCVPESASGTVPEDRPRGRGPIPPEHLSKVDARTPRERSPRKGV